MPVVREDDAAFLLTDPSEAVQVLVSTLPDGRDAIGQIVAALAEPARFGFLLLFISPDYPPEDISAGLATHAPNIPNAGCSTSGAMALGLPIERGVLALAFPRESVEVMCSPLFDLAHLTFEDGVDLAQGLKADLEQRADAIDHSLFALTLLDGLSRREEHLLAALEHVMGAIAVVGGSSGDNLSLTETFAVRNGDVRRGASMIILMRTSRAFRAFKSDRFRPTGARFVVTACDPATRTVQELNAEPAAEAYARAVGVAPEALDHSICCDHPLLVQVDGELFGRSIQAINPDGSLVFYSAVEAGVVFMLGNAAGLAESLEQSLVAVEAELGAVDLILGFECVQRKVEAENLAVQPALFDLYRRYRIAGFWTYGEQYHGLHLNYTFTGLAIGRKEV